MVLLKEKVVSHSARIKMQWAEKVRKQINLTGVNKMAQDQKTLDFIKSAELVHGVGTYDYSKSAYVNNKTKLDGPIILTKFFLFDVY